MNYRIIIFIICLFGLQGVKAQHRYIDTTQVLCIGEDNKIKIAIPRTSYMSLETTAQGGTIKLLWKDTWEAHPFRLGEDFIVTYSTVSYSGKRTKLFTHTYKVKEYRILESLVFLS